MRVYRHRHVVTFAETNLVGNVYFAHYLHWQGECRERFLAEHAPGVLDAVRTGTLALATVSCSMSYYAECFALDQVEVVMTLRARGAGRIAMDFEFLRNDQVVARGDQVVACLRRDNGVARLIAIPQELDAALSAFA
ncbi:4-hydroxybenzoyl-CoA thioesterase [Longimycelium tulufanense]|uniref:4-hydroxybenzoyl-CoA thioesterase n=1 Tax=Longimycelium tulufanense TaxID=907463 RepID=A0A8J3FVV7_9PSEU|nr:acyl-CoA thioesterase [Longimycelium tulufanense]GGM54458.1 4-hydroxybenzoyl-CoA thioesterase [Longimycelium tulufanense]